MVKILHFADAHINMANYGRQDPDTGLPLRVVDFLNSLDKIIAAAIEEQVDLVIFAGDAYKDRNPAPTYQREWERRIIRLSNADIPTILLVGNHDLTPSLNRAHALEEFNTLEIPNIIVADRPRFYLSENLWGLPLQLIALPWISRSGMVAHLGMSLAEPDKLYQQLETNLGDLVDKWLDKADPELPTILTAHASIQGASYGGERSVILGNDLVLSSGLVKDKRLDYVAMGHIHKPQDLNEGNHPPVVYPGSIERVDWGEAHEKKFYVMAEVYKGKTNYQWCEINGIRSFVERSVQLVSEEKVSEKLRKAMPEEDQIRDAIVRLTIEYPHEWEPLIDEGMLHDLASEAFEFHLVKRPKREVRGRLPEGTLIGSMTQTELLDHFWRSETEDNQIDTERLLGLAHQIIQKVESGDKD
ncbi:MAG: exonuclease SbcCD subunit D [Anaerolineales bacterium]|nr:exonuclease SbcCD subunit D [Anaerolineales bacterium]